MQLTVGERQTANCRSKNRQKPAMEKRVGDLKSSINIMSGRLLLVSAQLMVGKEQRANVRLKNRTKPDMQNYGREREQAG
jgi:hypothetical protein